MRQTEEQRLNYGSHAVIIGRPHPNRWTARIWWFAEFGNTDMNPIFEEEPLGEFASYRRAVDAAERKLLG